MKTRRLKGQPDDANRAMMRRYNDMDWEGIAQSLSRGEWDANRPLVHELQPGGVLLLRAAVLDGQIDIARQLIEMGADPNASIPGETKLLGEACQNGHRKMVDLL